MAVYTVPGPAMPELLAAHTVALAGRIVIDATNNMAAGGRELSAVRHLPDGAIAGFRAFNSVGWENMDNPVIGGEVADMFFAGPDGGTGGGRRPDRRRRYRPVYAGGSPAAFAAVDSVAGLWFALASAAASAGSCSGVLTEDGNA